MLPDALVFLGIYFAGILCVYLTGFAILLLLKNTLTIDGNTTRHFLSLFLGWISLVFIYSIYKSAGNTINLFLLLPFALVFFRKKFHLALSYNDVQLTSTGITQKMVLILVLLFPFIYFATVIFKAGDFHYAMMDYDNVIYSRLSEQLKNTGIENRWLNYFNDPEITKGAIPYHYLDLWFNAMVITVFSVKALPALYLVTYPVLISISLFGILAIVERFKPAKSFCSILAIPLLYIGPIYLIRTSGYQFNTLACELPFEHYGEKYAAYYPIILFTFLFFVNGYSEAFLIFLTLLCLASFTVFPAVVLFVFISLFVSRKQDGFEAKNTAIKAVIIFGAFLLFYLLNGNLSNGQNTELTLNVNPLNIKGNLLNSASVFLLSTGYFLANYFYTIPLLAWFLFHKNKLIPGTQLLAFWPLVGLLVMAAFYYLQDSYQLFTNTLPLFHCFVILQVITFLTHYIHYRKLVYLTVTILVINSFYSSYHALAEYRRNDLATSPGNTYLTRIMQLSGDLKPGTKIAHLYTQPDFDKLMSKPGGNYLAHLAYTNFDPLPYKLSCVNVTDFSALGNGRQIYTRLNEKEAFYRYFQKQITQPGQNPDGIKNSFLLQNGIRHVLISPNSQVPEFLRHRVKEIVNDSINGIRLLVLKQSH